MNDKILNKMDKLINKSLKENEVPVCAIIIKNNKIVASAYNKRNKSKNVLKHAEIIAIEKACKKLKDWRLNECEMIVSLEPCDMCKKVIEESRITKVNYLLKRETKTKSKTTYEEIKTNKNDEYNKILKRFFKSKR